MDFARPNPLNRTMPSPVITSAVRVADVGRVALGRQRPAPARRLDGHVGAADQHRRRVPAGCRPGRVENAPRSLSDRLRRLWDRAGPGHREGRADLGLAFVAEGEVRPHVRRREQDGRAVLGRALAQSKSILNRRGPVVTGRHDVGMAVELVRCPLKAQFPEPLETSSVSVGARDRPKLPRTLFDLSWFG